MKLHYISQYPIAQAVNNYCDEKAWKLGHPQHRHHQTAISDYLLLKMEPFISACKEENRDLARAVFLHKISQNLCVVRPTATACKEEIEGRIRQKLLTCFPDLVLAKEDSEEGFHSFKWHNAEGDIEVDAKWKVVKEGFFPPCIEIDSLRANPFEKKGRATHFLRAIVSTLQEDADPYAKIKLYAWTGYNSYYGRANGAFTWSRLGLELREYTKQDKINMAFRLTYSAVRSWKQGLLTSFDSGWCHNYFFSKLNKAQLDAILDPNFISLLNAEIEKCQNTWEVSAIDIQGIPIGRYLMATQDAARYSGVLYPNCPQSPGMVQYNKRLQELLVMI